MNKKMTLLSVNLQLFDGNTNVTTDAALSVTIKKFYDRTLLENAKPELVHDQFGQKKPIPEGSGKTIEFRRFHRLPKALTPLTEGVTPDGQKLEASAIEATVKQYGGYIEISDVLKLTAFDNVVTEATARIGQQAGETLDTITREVLNAGTNVQYAEGQVNSRSALVGGQATGNHYLTVECVRRAVRALKVQNAKTIKGDWVAIVHPDAVYDLTKDPLWLNVKTYDPSDLYEGEIGKILGVRFVETTEAKIFHGEGSGGRDVYSTLFLGANAYGITDIENGGLRHVIKQLGSAGTADPLDQRATVGWKAIKTAEILMEPFMLRVETASTFQSGEN